MIFRSQPHFPRKSRTLTGSDDEFAKYKEVSRTACNQASKSRSRSEMRDRDKTIPRSSWFNPESFTARKYGPMINPLFRS